VKYVLVAAALLAFASAPSAQSPAATPRDRLVVSAPWLIQHLHDPDLVLLQVGDEGTYQAGHIPGARYLDATSVHTMADENANGLTMEMPAPAVLHDRLAALGISDGSHVVLYESDDSWSTATRVFLTLDYAGLSNVVWLDGGLAAWHDAGQPLSKEAPLKKTGTLSPLKIRPIVVDAEFVKAHLHTPGFAIVDARDAVFYDGTRPGGPKDARQSGHIPGALSAPYDSFKSGERLKSSAEIASIFTKAGVKPGDTIIGYCHIGQQATAMLFAARTLGHPVMLYDGSFEDWSRRNLPVENPAKK
jgi:thiosulfate/3-mercaptopyruvate sulfurtransferase